MTETTPRRPWWRRKRTAAVLFVLAAYMLSFVPACWLLMRIDPVAHPTVYEGLRIAFVPVAAVLLNGPRSVLQGVARIIGKGNPEGDAALPAWPAGGPEYAVEFSVVPAGPGGSGRGYGFITHTLTPDGRLVNEIRRVW